MAFFLKTCTTYSIKNILKGNLTERYIYLTHTDTHTHQRTAVKCTYTQNVKHRLKAGSLECLGLNVFIGEAKVLKLVVKTSTVSSLGPKCPAVYSEYLMVNLTF